jgi:O-antigen ligase
VNTLRRLTAPFEGQPEPTTLGGYLTLLVGLVLAMAIHERDRVRRLAWWALAGLAFVPILFTLSRTTYVAAVVMLVALGAVTRHAMLLLSTGLALSLSPFLLPAKVLSRIAASFDATRAMGLDPSFVERITVWKKAGHALRLNPVLGFGLPQGIVDSQFARTLIETGLAGLAAWWVLLAACFLIGRRVRRRATDPAHRALAAGHMVGVVVLFVHALASVTFYIVRIMGPFFVLTALVASLDAYYRRARLPCAASADS